MRVMCLSFWVFDYMVQLANSLSKRETVILMLPKDMPNEHIDTLDENGNLHLFKQAKHLYSPTNLLKFYEIIKQINIVKLDVIHLQAGMNPFLCFAHPLLKKYPLVTTLHDPKPHLGNFAKKGDQSRFGALRGCLESLFNIQEHDYFSPDVLV